MAGRTGYRHPRRWTRALAALSIGAAATVATACAPITTQKPYAPSDGSRAVLGDEIRVENLLILTEAEGEPALVVGAITNHGDDVAPVTLTFGEDQATSTTVQVPPSDTVLLNPANPDGQSLVLDETPDRPGSSVPVTISTPSSGSTTVRVTVLDGTLDPYGDWLELIDS